MGCFSGLSKRIDDFVSRVQERFPWNYKRVVHAREMCMALYVDILAVPGESAHKVIIDAEKDDISSCCSLNEFVEAYVRESLTHIIEDLQAER